MTRTVEKEAGGMSRWEWLVLVIADGTVAGVEGGAPEGWISRPVDECSGMPDDVRNAAKELLAKQARSIRGTRARSARVEPAAAGEPSFTVVAIDAIPLRSEEVALEPLLLGALEPLLGQARRLGASLSLECAQDLPPRVALDPAKIAWAVTTLVGNALRYVRRGDGDWPFGRVVVCASHSDRRRLLRISVHDDGPGIPELVRRWLVAPDPETGRLTGISLRMVHDVVVAHGGRMVVKSPTGPAHRGTEVTLWLPTRGDLAVG
jgi:signal transduction histidine kinase